MCKIILYEIFTHNLSENKNKEIKKYIFRHIKNYDNEEKLHNLINV